MANLRSNFGLLAALVLAGLSVAACQSADTGRSANQGPLSIRIVEPVDGALLPTGTTLVRVEVTGMAEEDVHWHLAVNGAPQAMVDHSSETTVILAAGEVTLEASLAASDGDHADMPHVAPHQIAVTVSP